MDYAKLREEPLKSAIREDYFNSYKYTQLGNIDFVIAKFIVENEQGSLFANADNDKLKSILWAEAKQGTSHDIYESFVQLILTIGKEKTFEKYVPPKYIGAFDAEKIAFIEYHEIQHIFYQNDFNWNVTPSNHETKEFKQLFDLCKSLLEAKSMFFFYCKQDEELKSFIQQNFKTVSDSTEKIAVTKNNFTFVFQQWSEKVKPSIAVDWEKVNKNGIISADFFLADLLSENNESLKDNLFVVLEKTKYELARKIDEETGLFDSKKVGFNDKQKAHKTFWAIYERPPKEEYWSYIIERRDLLVPQDIRERKGSFFTPKIWVEKSQQYLAEVLGADWQDEYYIWDCCAGTGNLLNGLTNYRNVWASTLDKADVDVMKDRIQNGWNMFENHVFQFDFLNDEFSKLPDELREIVESEEKRKKLVIYINPPYAEAGTARTLTGTGQNKINVAVTQKTYEKYLDKIGIAGRELFAQFFIKIYCEINGCILAEFSKLKMLQAPNFDGFRNIFRAKLEKLFVVPAKTFDNVKGDFPIGFFIWNTIENGNLSPLPKEYEADVFDANGTKLQSKSFLTTDGLKSLTDWMISTRNRKSNLVLGFNYSAANDVQHNNYNRFVSTKEELPSPRGTTITDANLIESCVYLAVRHCIEPTWLNDRDQFLYPSGKWEEDKEFQGDCLMFTLFHGQNRISSEQGVNNWIPFTESEVGSKKAFKSVFMSKFIKDFKNGKVKIESEKSEDELFEQKEIVKQVQNDGLGETASFNFSAEAQAVYNAGLELWKFYFAQYGENENASFYDIRKHFQGTDEKGRMNNSSDNMQYNALIANLRTRQKALASKIAKKVYEYGFLR